MKTKAEIEALLLKVRDHFKRDTLIPLTDELLLKVASEQFHEQLKAYIGQRIDFLKMEDTFTFIRMISGIGQEAPRPIESRPIESLPISRPRGRPRKESMGGKED